MRHIYPFFLLKISRVVLNGCGYDMNECVMVLLLYFGYHRDNYWEKRSSLIKYGDIMGRKQLLTTLCYTINE